MIRNRESLFTRVCSNRSSDNGFNLEERRFRLDVRRKFFSQRAVKHWHSCPEKLWCPIPGGAQGRVGGPGQPELVGDSPAHGRGQVKDWNSKVFKVTFNPNYSVIP